MPDNEKQFETDIESFLISPAGGWQKATDAGYRSEASKGMAYAAHYMAALSASV